MKPMLAFAFIVALAINASALSPNASLRVKVVDEENKPVPGLSVTGWYEDRNALGDDVCSVVTNKTGPDGTTRFEGRVYNGWIDYGDIWKEGFYRIDGGRVNFTDITGVIVRKWEPYDKVETVTLQRIGNPIPLWVKEVRTARSRDLTTAADKKFCYDLVKGDWMPPFGEGERADMEFQLLPRENFGMGMGHSGKPKPSFRDTISARFLGEGNGLVRIVPPEHAILQLRTAPLDGYMNNYSIWFEQTKTLQRRRNTDTDKSLAFRIRTIKDEDGKIISALYGKVYGGFQMRAMVEYHPSGVEFTYYLNPTPNDRNLEWDMKHNLCPINDSFNQP